MTEWKKQAGRVLPCSVYNYQGIIPKCLHVKQSHTYQVVNVHDENVLYGQVWVSGCILSLLGKEAWKSKDLKLKIPSFLWFSCSHNIKPGSTLRQVYSKMPTTTLTPAYGAEKRVGGSESVWDQYEPSWIPSSWVQISDLPFSHVIFQMKIYFTWWLPGLWLFILNTVIYLNIKECINQMKCYLWRQHKAWLIVGRHDSQ